MASKRFPPQTKIYDVPDGGELRRMRRPDGITFAMTIAQEGKSDKPPVSLAVELQVTHQHGTLQITMRRIARRPDSWFCSTSSIHLPPRAAIDLAQSLTSLTRGWKP